MHPSDELREVKSKKLSHRRIVLGVTGSIAAVDTIRLARELIRHGAEVYPVMTKAATTIIHPYALEFATGNKPIVELSGKTEHVFFCGLIKDPVDLVLISPCTANTLSKIALGIDDTPVTTFTTTAIGSRLPILIIPAMHLSMYNHKIVQKNIEKCKELGISFLNPVLSKNKAKMASVDDIVVHVIRKIGTQDLTKKRILIIGGATAEPIDDIRVLTNTSSGKTAVMLATAAFERGADVTLWYGHATEPVPSYIPVKNFSTIRDLLKMINRKNLQFDGIIVCAALANYLPKKQKGKIPSGKTSLMIELTPAPSILETLRLIAPHSKLIAFKAEEKKKDLYRKAYKLLKKHKLDGVVANTISAFGTDDNEIVIVKAKGKRTSKKGKKEELAHAILDIMKS